MGAEVSLDVEYNMIFKVGGRVREWEEVAMKLVDKYTDLLLPRVILEESAYFPSAGFLAMSHISGS
jgi:hypothetical protein